MRCTKHLQSISSTTVWVILVSHSALLMTVTYVLCDGIHQSICSRLVVGRHGALMPPAPCIGTRRALSGAAKGARRRGKSTKGKSTDRTTKRTNKLGKRTRNIMCRQGFSGGLHREVVEKLDLDELLEDGLGASHLPLPREHLAHEAATPKLASRFGIPCDKSSGLHNPKAGSRGMLHLLENPPLKM